MFKRSDINGTYCKTSKSKDLYDFRNRNFFQNNCSIWIDDDYNLIFNLKDLKLVFKLKIEKF